MVGAAVVGALIGCSFAFGLAPVKQQKNRRIKETTNIHFMQTKHLVGVCIQNVHLGKYNTSSDIRSTSK